MWFFSNQYSVSQPRIHEERTNHGKTSILQLLRWQGFQIIYKKTINFKGKQVKASSNTETWYYKSKRYGSNAKEHTLGVWITKAIILNNGRRCVLRAVCSISSIEEGGAMKHICWHPEKHLHLYHLLKWQNPCVLNGTHAINSLVSVQTGNKSGKANIL